jgi:DNA-binding NtrC family response regulator
MPTILIIDDNPAVATALDVLLSLHDIDTLRASSPQEGLDVLQRNTVDLVIQDMNFVADTTSGEEGVALFHAIRKAHPDLPVILLTAWTHLEAAVELIKAGAADYLAKPWDDQKLVVTLNNLLELGESRRQLTQAQSGERQRRTALQREFDLRGIVYADPASEATLTLACQIARADIPVLITGPNGAGKERYAEVIHHNSAVKSGPFVALNCGALPAELIEAELFGAEAGAYTGATKAREGKFEAADGGTLFLDEIGTLPLAGQVKLLRVLETGRFQRLGSNRERTVKVRIVSATNADLPALIAEGKFREDLFYRLNGIELKVSPLAARRRDILPLAWHFLSAGKTLSEDAERVLQQHNWPGNVRELRNVMQRAALLATGSCVQAADLGLPIAPASVPSSDELDRATIEATLARCGGVLAQAASELGLSRQALYRRLDRLGIARS